MTTAYRLLIAGVGLPVFAACAGSFFMTGSMAEPRSGHVAVQLNRSGNGDSRVLVAGGYKTPPWAALSSAEVYDGGQNKFVPTGGMKTGHVGATASWANASDLSWYDALVIGGYGGQGSGTTMERYNYANGTFSSNPLAHDRVFHATAGPWPGSSREVFSSGGWDPYEHASAEIYNPGTRLSTIAAEPLQFRVGHTMTLLMTGQILIAGGTNGTTAELYDPTTKTYTYTGNMTVSRMLHTATLVRFGPSSTWKVLIAGGRTGDGSVQYASAELYDPVTHAFTPTGSMSVPRVAHTATWFPVCPGQTPCNSGRILVAGGARFGETNASAEIYDPATGTFTATGHMNVPRVGHTATLLDNYRILIAGGHNSTGALSSAEIYITTR